MDRELGEIIAYAITAYKKSIPVNQIFTVVPTDANGYMAEFVVKALEYNLKNSNNRLLVKAVEALPTVCWWHADGHPVFNSANGDDLVFRSDVLTAISSTKESTK